MPVSNRTSGSLATTNRPVGDPAAPLGQLTVVPHRGGDGLGISVKVDRSGRQFRIEPARDPRAPRFWCLRVYRYGTMHATEESAASWYDIGGMTRADLPAAVASIRADPTAWLAAKAGAALRAWMLAEDAPLA